jgi:DNA topoisomerase-1
MRVGEASENIVGPRDAAESAGPVEVNDEALGITRQRSGKGRSCRRPDGSLLADFREIERINKLAIPPVDISVWICPDHLGHLQATGRDAKGRKRYRYYPRFREIRISTKYEHMIIFADSLPGIRTRIDEDMGARGLTSGQGAGGRHTPVRDHDDPVGNADHTREDKSYGLTTLANRHVRIEGSELRFRFKGKSGKKWNSRLRDRRVARIVRQAQDQPGQHLFQYLDEAGERRAVASSDVNASLKEIAGTDVTAKGFRTWTETVLAALALSELEKVDSEAAAKRNIPTAIEQVAARPRQHRLSQMLRSPGDHRQFLVDALVLEISREVERELSQDIAGLRPEEALALAFLCQRLSQKQIAVAA